MTTMTAKLFYDLHSVKTLLFRRWSPITRLSSNINKNCRRDAHSTIDPNDLFQANPKVLRDFWDTEGTFKPLHSFNYLRVPYIRDSLVEVAPGEKFSTCLKGKKILDVGCGPGLLSEGLAKLGAEVTGVDTNRELIKMAQSHSSQNKRLANNLPSYIWTDIEEHSIACAEKYDAIVVSEVIEHVSEKELFVESCVRAAKPGGKLLFTTPNRTRFAQFFLIFIFEDVLRNLPKGTHQYDKFMRPSELQYMLEMNDCFVESTKGYFYYPWGNNWEWTKSKIFGFAIEAVKSK
ncbi:ubiquinone biosynthesis O-methyltransferase, mitochondrial-like [Pararge aegeria]|uniref:ubiquinone biosynthesis O-methyltransferase, mitochondrial-like n=1 Tax=Pararge aegeria TaxID=116150 RepID=UPI0019D04820|nr:ubiquinone biosynthesis O-methyltransferase, mitochondrial-like [Pararge aegeria]